MRPAESRLSVSSMISSSMMLSLTGAAVPWIRYTSWPRTELVRRIKMFSLLKRKMSAPLSLMPMYSATSSPREPAAEPAYRRIAPYCPGVSEALEPDGFLGGPDGFLGGTYFVPGTLRDGMAILSG